MHETRLTSNSRIYRDFGKRVFDVMAVLVFLPIVLPIIAVVAILVRSKIGSPVFFTQVRPGLYGQAFKMVKFRSMTDARDADGALLPDDMRITSFGQKLRGTSLDELPELWNVLRGEMSIVGPRPLLMEYLPLYSEQQKKRHNLRPGITGLAQSRGRNLLTWDEKFAADVEYVDRCSLWLDIKILVETVRILLKKDGISATDNVTMPRFTGSLGTGDGREHK